MDFNTDFVFRACRDFRSRDRARGAVGQADDDIHIVFRVNRNHLRGIVRGRTHGIGDVRRRKQTVKRSDEMFRQIQNMAAEIGDDAAAGLAGELPFQRRLRIRAARMEIRRAEFENVADGAFVDELLGA